MCYVIITCRSLLWTLLSITCFMFILVSVMSPNWLIGFPRGHPNVTEPTLGIFNRCRRIYEFKFPRDDSDINNCATYVTDFMMSDSEFPNVTEPTLGIFNRCRRIYEFKFPRDDSDINNCATYVTDFMMSDSEFPNVWKAALIFFGIALVMLMFAAIAAVLSLCVRALCGKSLFTLCGLVQSIAGLLCIIGMMLYPSGWGSPKVKDYCGKNANPFDLDQCRLGWSFYLCIVGTLATFLCAVLSIKADASTSSHKVEEEVLEGKYLICVA